MIETGTQSCGRSRFGCWVCTVVDRDKSMENFIDNGEKWMEELLDFRNWLYDIRQQTYQYVPKRLQSNVKFGPFLLKIRWEILNKLLEIQKNLPVELIKNDEVKYIRNFLKEESKGKTKNGVQKFIFELPNGRRIATIADFNLLLPQRKRLGPMYLKRGELIKTQVVSSSYAKSTRVMYYEA